MSISCHSYDYNEMRLTFLLINTSTILVPVCCTSIYDALFKAINYLGAEKSDVYRTDISNILSHEVILSIYVPK